MLIRFSPFATSLFRSQVAPPLTLPLLLSCPQIVTARILTSQLHCLVGGLSKKKQTLTTQSVMGNKKYSLNMMNMLLALNKTILGQIRFFLRGNKKIKNW